jgi:CheY-like chemotaxis protein
MHNRGGLGLGLSIVKILVGKHGGTVRAESEGVDRGAVFTVTLPLSDGAPRPVEDPVEVHSADAKTLRGVCILLVEDDTDSREVLQLFVEQSGGAVRSAESAKAAMAILTSGSYRPNVIISDLAMPDEDGYSLIRRIRRLPAESGGAIPALALSAFATNESRQKAFDAGFQRYRTKPFEPDLLVEDIVKLINGSE